MIRKPWVAPSVLAGACLALIVGTASASAGTPEPVCRVSTVVSEMARQIRERIHYAYVDPRLVTEQMTPQPNIVHCQVCIQNTPYDMPQFGAQPVRRCVPQNFEVRIFDSGYVVQDLP
jgi:hypothetical protein